MPPSYAPSSPQPPSIHRLALLTWLGVYPVLTAIAMLLDPMLALLSIPLRTLIMSAIMVPIMVYAVMPLITRLTTPIRSHRTH